MIYKIKIAFFLFFLLMINSSDVSAQFAYSCYDSLRQPNPYYPCDTYYDPVCGCDGVTYRNSDCARGIGGLNTSVVIPVEGPCGDIDVYIVSNFVTEIIDYHLYYKFPGTIKVAIYDMFGTLFFFDNPNFEANTPLNNRQIPVQHLRHGVYFLVVFFNGEPVTKKFVKAVRD